MISLTMLCKEVTCASLRNSGNFDDFKKVLKSLHEKLLNIFDSLYMNVTVLRRFICF